LTHLVATSLVSSSMLALGQRAALGSSGEEPFELDPQPPLAESGAAGVESLQDARLLVTVEGQTIPIREGAEVVGSQVRYTTRAGALIAIDLEVIDLEATVQASAAATAALAQGREAVRAGALPLLQRAQRTRPTSTPVRLELDDSEVGSFVPPEGASEEEVAAAWRERLRAAAPSGELSVVSWQDVGTDGKPAIYGVVRNDGSAPVSAPAVEVRLLDQDGAVLATQQARIQVQRLAGGGEVRFSALFTRAISYDSVEFEPR
jgi:hypothetical protein